MDSIKVSVDSSGTFTINGQQSKIKYSLNSNASSLLNGLDAFKDYFSTSTQNNDGFGDLSRFIQDYINQNCSHVAYGNLIHNFTERSLHEGENIMFDFAGDRTVSNFIPGIEHFFAECGPGYKKVLLNPKDTNLKVYQTTSQYADEGPGSGPNFWPDTGKLEFDENFMKIYGFHGIADFGNMGFDVKSWIGYGDKLAIKIDYPDTSLRSPQQNTIEEALEKKSMKLATQFAMTNKKKNDFINNMFDLRRDGSNIILKALGDAMQNATYLAFCIQHFTQLDKCLMSTCDYTVHLRNILSGLPSNYYGKKKTEETGGVSKSVGTLFLPIDGKLNEDQRKQKLFNAELEQIIFSNNKQLELLNSALNLDSSRDFVWYGKKGRSRRPANHSVKSLDWGNIVNKITLVNNQLKSDKNQVGDVVSLRYFRIPNFVILGKYSNPTDPSQSFSRYEFSTHCLVTSGIPIIQDLYDELLSIETIAQTVGGGCNPVLNYCETRASSIYSIYIDVIWMLHITKILEKELVTSSVIDEFDSSLFILNAIYKVIYGVDFDIKYSNVLQNIYEINMDKEIIEISKISEEEATLVGVDLLDLKNYSQDELFTLHAISYYIEKNDEEAEKDANKLRVGVRKDRDYDYQMVPNSDDDSSDDYLTRGYHVSSPKRPRNKYRNGRSSNARGSYRTKTEGPYIEELFNGGSSKLSKKKKRKNKVKRGKKASNKKKVKRVVKRKYSHKKRNKKK